MRKTIGRWCAKLCFEFWISNPFGTNVSYVHKLVHTKFRKNHEKKAEKLNKKLLFGMRPVQGNTSPYWTLCLLLGMNNTLVRISEGYWTDKHCLYWTVLDSITDLGANCGLSYRNITIINCHFELCILWLLWLFHLSISFSIIRL